MSLSLETLTSSSFISIIILCPQNQLPNDQDSTMMKSGYNNTIHKEGELKPLTNANAGIPETGGSPITKKHLVLVSLGMLIMGLIMGFMMGHLTNTQHSGLRMSQESITTQLVDSKEDVSTCTPPCVHQWI